MSDEPLMDLPATSALAGPTGWAPADNCGVAGSIRLPDTAAEPGRHRALHRVRAGAAPGRFPLLRHEGGVLEAGRPGLGQLRGGDPDGAKDDHPPDTEHPLFLVLVSLGGALTLLTIQRWTFADRAFPFYIFLFPGFLAVLIWWRQSLMRHEALGQGGPRSWRWREWGDTVARRVRAAQYSRPGRTSPASYE